MVDVTLQARDQDSITVSIAAAVGETVFEIELNRAEDFASDESIVATNGAAGGNVIAGLPAGTPFFIRARKMDGGPGPWSAPLLAATLSPGAPGAYAGWSVAPALLVVPEPIDQPSCGQATAGSSAANLLNDDPLSVLRARGGTIDIVFRTAGRPVDSVSLLGTMASETATIAIAAANSHADVTGAAPPFSLAATRFRASANLGLRPSYHSFQRLGGAQIYPWWRVRISHSAPEFIARNLVIGLARQSVNLSRGARTSFMDLGTVNRNRFGSPDRVHGWRGRMVEFGLSWLREAEYHAKWSDLEALVGGTAPVLAIPNTAANQYLHDRIAFGNIEQTSGELMRGDRYGKTLEIRSLY